MVRVGGTKPNQSQPKRTKTTNAKKPTNTKSIGNSSGTPQSVTPSASIASPTGRQANTPCGRSPVCMECGVPVGSDTPALQCDECMKFSAWKCIDCLKIPIEMYEALVDNSGSELMWNCVDCCKQRDVSKRMECLLSNLEAYGIAQSAASLNTNDDLVTRLTSVEGKVDRMLQMMGALTDRMNTIEKKVDDSKINDVSNVLMDASSKIESHFAKMDSEMAQGPSETLSNVTIEKVVEKAIEKQIETERDEEERKKNIIVYRVQEAKGTVEERRKHDLDYLLQLSSVLEADITQDDIVKWHRLGKVSDDANYDRPLMASFREVNKKANMMKNAYKLKNANGCFSRVSLCDDLPPQQRESMRKMIKDAKQSVIEEGGNPENWKYLVVGPPNRMRVVKKKKQDQH